MSTSPIGVQSQHRTFLPPFLTGETYQSPTPLHRRPSPQGPPLISALTFETEGIFETPEKAGVGIGTQTQAEAGPRPKPGPPVTGLARNDLSPILVLSAGSNGGGGFSPARIPLTALSGQTGPGSLGSIPKSPQGSLETTDWVTIFGFPASSAPHVLTQFSQ
jgi:hypothetical protein